MIIFLKYQFSHQSLKTVKTLYKSLTPNFGFAAPPTNHQPFELSLYLSLGFEVARKTMSIENGSYTAGSNIYLKKKPNK